MKCPELMVVSVLGVLAACTPNPDTVRFAVCPETIEAAPDIIDALSDQPGLVRTEVGTPGTSILLALQGTNLLISLPHTSPLFDRRDMAIVDTIDLTAVDRDALTKAVVVRIAATGLALSEAGDDRERVETLRQLIRPLPDLIEATNPALPLGEDLRTSYRQALFQIASETKAAEDAQKALAFEKAEAALDRGVDGPNRYDRARAWYYFASAQHLQADLSSETDIASAFAGFKDAQRPFSQDREAKRQTLRTSHELAAARTRIGQLLHAIGTLRGQDMLLDEADYAFRSAAGIWFEATGSTAPFCFNVDPQHDGTVTCLDPDDAVTPDL